MPRHVAVFSEAGLAVFVVVLLAAWAWLGLDGACMGPHRRIAVVRGTALSWALAAASMDAASASGGSGRDARAGGRARADEPAAMGGLT